MTDPRCHVGPMDRLYDLVLGSVESRYDRETRARFERWLGSVRPTTGHLAVMMTEMALSGRCMGRHPVRLLGFAPNGEPIIGLRAVR